MASRLLHFVVLLGLLPAAAMAGERPLVVELCPSEGRSSCPPAAPEGRIIGASRLGGDS